MRRLVVPAAAALVVAAAGLAGLQACGSREWESRAVRALEVAEEATARADSLEVVASAANTRAEEMAKLAGERGRWAQGRVVEIREVVVPDTCAPFVAPRDEVIDTFVVVVEGWGRAWEEALRARASLQAANLSLRLALDSTTSVLRDRPGQGSRWLPSVGLGLFAGVCAGGAPCAGAGATLSWSVR